MSYLVIVDKDADSRIAKEHRVSTRVEADTFIIAGIVKYPDAFVVDNPPDYVWENTIVDMVAKTFVYDKDGYNTAKAMREWGNAMMGTDSSMPRYAEDILDGMPDKSGVAQITLDRLQAKKDLRATKP